MAVLTIIHTTDLHNRLTRERAASIAALRDKHPDALLLDSGDALRASNVHFSPLGEPILAAMHQLGYTAMAVGNREFHVWPSWMARKLRQARFPMLAANIHPAWPALFRESIIVEAQVTDGRTVRVGITGALHPMVREGTLAARLSGFTFEDPIEAVSRISTELADETDVVVALAHTRTAAARSIAAMPTVDLTLAGHTHRLWCQATRGAAAVCSGYHGRWVSVVRMDVDSRAIEVEQCAL